MDKYLAQGVLQYFCSAVGATEKSVLRHWDEPEENFVDVVTCNNIYSDANTRVASTLSLSNHPLMLNEKIFPVRVEFVMLGEPEFPIMENVLATAAFSVIKDGFFPRPGAVISDVMNVYEPRTKLPNVYLADPFPWDDALHSKKIGAFDVTWLLVFPISESESDYIDQEGDEKFESLLEEHSVNVFDYARDPFI